MKRRIAFLVGALTALALALGPAASAATTDPPYDAIGNEITRWDQTFALQADGSVDVTLEIDFDFGNDPGHGPYMVLPIRQGFDDTFDRVYRISDVEASSPTGAPANVYLTDERNWLTVRIGDENIGDVSGVQTYVITWSVAAVMNETTDADLGGSSDDVVGEEFYWNAVGDGWVIPISNATVRVTSPVAPDLYDCWAGPEYSTTPCDATVPDGTTVTFSHGFLYPGQPFTVATLYPPGNFATEPALIESSDFARAFRITPWSVGGALLVLVGGGILLWRRLRMTAVDEQYAGLTPGLTPTGDMEHQVERRDYDAPVAVRFEPPQYMRPGQIGTLVDEKADPRDVTATIVDLAVRGYMRIDYVGETGSFLAKTPDYRLVKLRDPDPAMIPYEMSLFDAIFELRDEVTLSQLKTTFAADMAKVQSQLYQNVVDLGWFRKNPSTVRASWMFAGIAIVGFGIFATVLLANTTSIALVGLPFIVLGVVTIFTAKNAPARTAAGTAVLVEAQGFERYLTTAEANQLKFEEGQDIFSKYLPFAIAFGVAHKWAKKFEELAAQGVKLPEPTWLGSGYATGAFWAHSTGFGESLSQFASLADSAISAPTPGSSGGSGFSSGGGGGGFSGGGGGGGGGGGW
jgi:uncharacterized protein (TIGR04222 family)